MTVALQTVTFKGLIIEASETSPKTLTAVDRDLHVGARPRSGPHAPMVARLAPGGVFTLGDPPPSGALKWPVALYAGRSMRISQRCVVMPADGPGSTEVDVA